CRAEPAEHETDGRGHAERGERLRPRVLHDVLREAAPALLPVLGHLLLRLADGALNVLARVLDRALDGAARLRIRLARGLADRLRALTHAGAHPGSAGGPAESLPAAGPADPASRSLRPAVVRVHVDLPSVWVWPREQASDVPANDGGAPCVRTRHCGRRRRTRCRRRDALASGHVGCTPGGLRPRATAQGTPDDQGGSWIMDDREEAGSWTT